MNPLSLQSLKAALAYAAADRGILRRIRVPPYLYRRFADARLIPYDGVPIEPDSGLETSLVIDYYRLDAVILHGIADAAITA